MCYFLPSTKGETRISLEGIYETLPCVYTKSVFLLKQSAPLSVLSGANVFSVTKNFLFVHPWFRCTSGDSRLF